MSSRTVTKMKIVAARRGVSACGIGLHSAPAALVKQGQPEIDRAVDARAIVRGEKVE